MADAAGLGEGHRTALGARLDHMAELLGQAHVAGFESETLHEVADALEAIRAETAAPESRLRKNLVQASLAQMFVLASEFSARSLKAYGELTPEAAAYLDRTSRRLEELTRRLLDEYESATKRSGAHAV
jgi:hypothetical protein